MPPLTEFADKFLCEAALPSGLMVVTVVTQKLTIQSQLVLLKPTPRNVRCCQKTSPVLVIRFHCVCKPQFLHVLTASESWYK